MPHSSSQVQGCGWVRSAYLTTDPMMLQEGNKAITQAVSDHRVKARGPGCPRMNLLVKQPFRFNPSRPSLSGDALTPYGADGG